jgi:hypothetical protein
LQYRPHPSSTQGSFSVCPSVRASTRINKPGRGKLSFNSSSSCYLSIFLISFRSIRQRPRPIGKADSAMICAISSCVTEQCWILIIFKTGEGGFFSFSPTLKEHEGMREALSTSLTSLYTRASERLRWSETIFSFYFVLFLSFFSNSCRLRADIFVRLYMCDNSTLPSGMGFSLFGRSYSREPR